MLGIKFFLSGVGVDNVGKSTCCWGWLAKVVVKNEEEEVDAVEGDAKKRKKVKKSTCLMWEIVVSALVACFTLIVET